MSRSIVGRVVRAAGRATRLTRIDPRDAALSARMALWVVLVSLLARVLPLPRAHRITATRLRGGPDSRREGGHADAARLARALDRVLGLDLLVFRRSCWRRAMVLHRFLARQGIESRINFGVKTTDGVLTGHAWLERDGEPFLEDAAGAYVVTFSLPHEPAPCAAP